MIVVGRGQCAAIEQQACGGFAGFAASGFERLGFAAVAVRLVEELLQQRRELGRQLAVLEFLDHALDGGGLQALLFQSGEGGLQDLGWRLAEAATALAVEIHRRRMQAQQHGRRLHGIGLGTVVFSGEFFESEFLFAADFPEKTDVDPFRVRFAALQQFARRRGGKAQQHVGRLHLGTLAGRKFDLQGRDVVGQHGAGTESAVLFKQDIHGGKIPGGGRERETRGRIIPVRPWRQEPCWSAQSHPPPHRARGLRPRPRRAPAAFRRAGVTNFPPRRRRDRESPASRRRHC